MARYRECNECGFLVTEAEYQEHIRSGAFENLNSKMAEHFVLNHSFRFWSVADWLPIELIHEGEN